MTPLIMALEMKNIECVKMLVKRGAQINVKDTLVSAVKSMYAFMIVVISFVY